MNGKNKTNLILGLVWVVLGLFMIYNHEFPFITSVCLWTLVVIDCFGKAFE